MTGSEADTTDRIAALRSLIEEALDTLKQSQKDEKYYRAVHTTYIKQTPSQAVAAERLDVPFSTYRRHLKRGIDQVAEKLWYLETA